MISLNEKQTPVSLPMIKEQLSVKMFKTSSALFNSNFEHPNTRGASKIIIQKTSFLGKKTIFATLISNSSDLTFRHPSSFVFEWTW